MSTPLRIFFLNIVTTLSCMALQNSELALLALDNNLTKVSEQTFTDKEIALPEPLKQLVDSYKKILVADKKLYPAGLLKGTLKPGQTKDLAAQTERATKLLATITSESEDPPIVKYLDFDKMTQDHLAAMKEFSSAIQGKYRLVSDSKKKGTKLPFINLYSNFYATLTFFDEEVTKEMATFIKEIFTHIPIILSETDKELIADVYDIFRTERFLKKFNYLDSLQEILPTSLFKKFKNNFNQQFPSLTLASIIEQIEPRKDPLLTTTKNTLLALAKKGNSYEIIREFYRVLSLIKDAQA